MATQSEIEAYQTVIDGLSTVAYAQLKSLLQQLDNPNPIAFRDALLATYPELMRPFMSSASDVAAQWYTSLRLGAGVRSTYAPVIAFLPDEQLEAGIRYALTPLFAPVGSFESDIFTRLAGFSQKMIANSGRDTVINSATYDAVRVGYQRVPRTGCCAFCGLLASRGAVYRSAASAGSTVGRGVDASLTAGKVGGQGQGLKARGNQQIGKAFHEHCRCVVAPVFVGGDNDYLKYSQQHFTKLYTQTGGIVDGATNLKATLSSWREEHGTK